MKKFLIILCLCITLLAACSFAASAAEIGNEATEQSFFSLLYETAGAHLTEILSAFSAACTILIAFCYKRGLLPILKNGIGAIGSATKKWGENAEIYGKEAKKICENANNYIQDSAKRVEEVKERLTGIEKHLSDLTIRAKENEQMRFVLEGQMEMLCDVFLSSSLPQFEKDRVSQKIERMKQLLHPEEDGGMKHA